MQIPIYVQPPCKPNKAQLAGVGWEDWSEERVIQEIEIPRDRVLCVVKRKIKGVKQWVVVTI